MLIGLTNLQLFVRRAALLSFSVLLCGSVAATAAITLDNTSTQMGVSGSTSLTWNHTLGTGANRTVVCGVTIANTLTAIAPFAPAMTFNGIAMTAVPIPATPATTVAPIHSQTSTAKIEAGMFYINDTSIGSLAGGVYAVALTLPQAPTGPVAVGCTSLFGAAQAGPEAVGSVYNGSSPAMTVTLTTTTANDWIIDAFGGGFGSAGTATVNAGQTQLYNVQQGGKATDGTTNAGALAGSSYEQVATAGSVSVGWTNTVSRYAYEAAAFAPATVPSYTVTATTSPSNGGSITLSPNLVSYPTGTSVQVTATPATNYSFTSFSGAVTGATNPQTFVVGSNTSVTANFTVNTCTLTINVVGSGSVLPATGSTYACGTVVSVAATPASGWSFAQYTGGLTGSNPTQSITMNGDMTVTATFINGTPCTLTTGVTGSGSITVNPTGTTFTCGTQLTITAVPSAGQYSFTGWSGALTGTTNPQTLTLSANSTVGASFAQTSFPINVTTVGAGTVAASPSAAYYPTGTQVTLTATPTAGSYFSGFSGGATGGSPATVTVNGTTNVTATFVTPVITQDAVSHAASAGVSASSLSWSHTLGAGSSRAIVIAVGETDSAASPDQYAVVTSVTLNGVYATPVPNSLVYGGTSGMVQSQLFYLLDSELPPAGTYTIQVNLAGSIGGISAGAVSLFGVNQGPPEVVATNKDTTGADLITSSITTLTNNAWVIDAVEDGDIAVLTANSGQTLQWQAEAKSGTGGSSTKAVPTAGLTTMGWAGSANRFAQAMMDFAPATGTVPPTYTLTTSASAGGTVSTNPNLSVYPSAAGVLLTATAQTGYVFSGWSGDYTSTANPLPITMTSNHTVTANFSSVATCTLTTNIVGSGTLNIPSGTAYNCGTVLQLIATAGSGFTFTSYSGDFSSTDNPTYFTLSANSTITVEFDAIPQCTLTVNTTGSGTTTGGGTYACGASVPITATPASNWIFNGWSGDYSSPSSAGTVSLTQDETITATFVQGSACTLTTTIIGNGTVTPSSGTYLCGTQITLSAVPDAKYLFNGWSGAVAGTTTPIPLTMSTNQSVTATFAINLAGVTGDPRTVTEPVYPPVCTVLTAAMSVSSPVETSPDTARVQAAINACPAGQAVEFSASGTNNAFIIAPIILAPGVTMLVDPEVTILGSIKYADYACITSDSWCSPLIMVDTNAAPAVGSAIMGDGVIDGRGGTTLTDKGKSWWATGSDTRPRLIYLGQRYPHNTYADDFTMYKITLKNSPKFHFSGLGNNLTIWGVKIYSPPDSPNTDGIDPSGSQNITITNSYISDGDDMIAMKAGVGHVANVTISNNHMYSGHGITVGSETNAGLNNMYVHDDAIDNGFGGSSFDSLRIKSDTSRGGEVYDVLYKNICIQHGGDTIVIDPYYSSESGSLYPNFHDITFSNVHQLIRDSSHKSTMTGYNTGGVVNALTVALDNVSFDGAIANDFKAPDNFNNVQFSLGPGPVSFASFLQTDAAVPANFITVSNAVSNSNAPFDCTGAFVYLAGDLTAKTATVTAGTSATLTAVLQNVVSPLVAGTTTTPQQIAPTGTINILEGATVVGTGILSGRLASIAVPNVTAGSHTYTATYTGNSSYPALNFGSFTVTATAAANPPPVAAAQSVTVPYNTATAVTLNATGSGAMTYSVVANPSNGALSGTAPNLTYTPTANYSGADSFTFKANNGSDSNIATVSITVLPAAPVANPQSVTAAYNTAVPITLSATGSGAITFSVTNNPTHGVLGGSLPNLTYTSTTNYSGTDSFTFKANNGTDSNVATVSITVLPAAPVAAAQSVTVAYNTATAVTLSATGSGTLTYSVVASPTHGTLSGTAPNLTYTPASGYNGADSFTFKANNGTDSNVATVSLTVLPAAPVANAQSVTLPFNTAKPITLTATGSGTLTYAVVTNPAHGTLSGTAPNLTYTPTTGYSGADSFTFTANNGTTSTPATVSITVLAAAPVASAQSVSAPYNTATAVTLSATGGGTLTYSVVANPSHGTLSGTAPNLTYTPASGYSGADSFTFKANNGTDSNVATVSITVAAAPPPPAPVAAAQSVTVAFNTATAVTLSATGSGTITYTVVASPTHGTLSGAAPNLTYTPTAGYAGTDSFTFKANNGTDSNVATVSITVNGGLVWTSTGGSLSATVHPGQTATYLLQIAGWTGATGSVSFTCTGVPAYSICTVTPNPAVLNGTTPVPVTITVVTQSVMAALRGAPATHVRHGFPLAVMAGLIGCFAGLRRLKGKRGWGVLAACVALAMVLSISGCGGGVAAPTDAATGTYSISVTAVYGTVTKTAPLTLIIQ